MTMARQPLATLGLALLIGCATTPPPESVDLEVTLPQAWTAADSEAAAVEPPPSEWWSDFGDDRLSTLIEGALDANRDLSAAAIRIEAAAAQARIAGADLYPSLDVSAGGGRARNNFIGLPIPGGGGRVLSTTTSTFGATLNVVWEPDLWGRIHAAAGAGLAGVEAAEADLVAARLSLAGQTAKAWFALQEAELQVELAEETLESRRSTRQRIRRRYELGTRPALDLRRAMTNEAAAESTLAARRRQLDASRRQIDLLLSRYPAGRIELADESAALTEPPAGVPAGLPSELITRRPDLAATERRLAAVGLGIKQARAALYPRLPLTGSAGTLSAEIADLLDDSFSVWSLAANLLQPVFEGGRLRAGVALADARYRELAEGYAQTILRAFAEVELALAAEGYLASQKTALETAAEQSVEAQRLAEDRYGAGLEEYLTVLEAQRDANLAQASLLTVRREQLDARVDLYLALGGGFVADRPSPETSTPAGGEAGSETSTP